jgi:hypothetical protein
MSSRMPMNCVRNELKMAVSRRYRVGDLRLASSRSWTGEAERLLADAKAKRVRVE